MELEEAEFGGLTHKWSCPWTMRCQGGCRSFWQSQRARLWYHQADRCWRKLTSRIYFTALSLLFLESRSHVTCKVMPVTVSAAALLLPCLPPPACWAACWLAANSCRKARTNARPTTWVPATMICTKYLAWRDRERRRRKRSNVLHHYARRLN